MVRWASWHSKSAGGLVLHLAFSGSQLVGLCKFPAKHRELAAVSTQGCAGCITPVPECFKFFYSQEHQLLWDASKGSLFQCLSSRKLVAVIKIKQTRKWLALLSGIFVKMEICNSFRLKWYLKIQRRREGGFILAILVHPHWNRIKIWCMVFYLCLIYLQKQINVLVAQHPSTELRKPTAVYLPPGIAGQAMDLCRRIKSVKQAEEILSLDALVSWHYPQLFLLTENKFR